MSWKNVGVSKVSILYIYIYIYRERERERVWCTHYYLWHKSCSLLKKLKPTNIIFYHNFDVLINNNGENIIGSLFYKNYHIRIVTQKFIYIIGEIK